MTVFRARTVFRPRWRVRLLLVSVEFESTLIFTGEFMFKRNKICTAALAALGGTLLATSLPVLAQGEQRVEITGSAIKRIDAETAVPVTVLRVEELRRQGITTVEQIVMSISAGQVTTGTSQVVGSGSGGASFADLRLSLIHISEPTRPY